MRRRSWGWAPPVLMVGLFLAAASVQRVSALSVPNQFCTGDPCIISSPREADPGIALDFGTRTVILQSTLTMRDLPSGAVGSLTIKAGSFSITGGGQVKGFSSSAPGGALTIEVLNNIQINSTVGSGAVRLSGQDAGSLTLVATAGPVNVAGRITLYGDGIIGSGGTLSIDSGSTITITGELDMHGGLQGSGGDLDINAVGDTLMTGFVDMTGGDVGGGFLDITAGGSLTLRDIDMSGSGEAGDAGFVIIDVGGTVRFQGEFRGRGADNGEDCGDGADLDITALGDIFISAEMDIRGRGTDCSGGSLALDAASIFLQTNILMSGTGSIGGGGDMDATATTLFRHTGNLELDGGESGGGDVFVASDRDIEILGSIVAIGRSANSPGATAMDFEATKRITVSGTIDASAGSSGQPGTPVSLVACDVITNPSAVIRALGNEGSIAITANDTMQLRGQFRAAPNGGIALRYGPTANPPDIAGASFIPLPTQTLDPTLLPCRVCTTGADCDDGNPCTDDVCDVTQCLNPPLDDSPCEDGDPCSVNDFCQDGICVSGPVGTCNDADQDGKSDATDECTTLIWTAPPTKRPDQNPLRFIYGVKRLSAPDAEQRFLVKGKFNVAPSQPLLIDPSGERHPPLRGGRDRPHLRHQPPGRRRVRPRRRVDDARPRVQEGLGVPQRDRCRADILHGRLGLGPHDRPDQGQAQPDQRWPPVQDQVQERDTVARPCRTTHPRTGVDRSRSTEHTRPRNRAGQGGSMRRGPVHRQPDPERHQAVLPRQVEESRARRHYLQGTIGFDADLLQRTGVDVRTLEPVRVLS